MRTMYKYPLKVEGIQDIEIPSVHQLCTVQVQNDLPCLWALVSTDEPMVKRKIVTHGTGHPINSESIQYIGTYQLLSGAAVFHVFYEV